MNYSVFYSKNKKDHDIAERIFAEMKIIDSTYNDKWYAHRVIRFLRDNP